MKSRKKIAMKRTSLFWTVVFMLLLVPQANAAGWSKPARKIKSIEVSDVSAPGVWLTFVKAPVFSPKPNCGNGTDYWLGSGASPDSVNKMTDAAIAAFMNSRDVTVYWDG